MCLASLFPPFCQGRLFPREGDTYNTGFHKVLHWHFCTAGVMAAEGGRPSSRVLSLGMELSWGDWTLSFLYPCPLLKLECCRWFGKSPALFFVFVFCFCFFIICGSQSGVQGASNLESNSPHLCAWPPTPEPDMRTISKGRPMCEWTQWLKEFLGKSANAAELRRI